MEIIIQNTTIDTKDICDIKDIEYNKTMFLNRTAGFIVFRINKPPILFSESIPYESTPFRIHEIKSKWEQLQKRVYEKWQKDKTVIEVFNV